MADVVLNITVPDAWTTKVLSAFNAITDTHITIDARDPDPASFNGRWDFTIAAKGGGESNKQFGERVLRELGKAVVHMVDKAEDYDRYKTAVAAVPPAESDVPDGVLT
jgi:hypothetical protein